jgi:dihydrofolate synthase/folylpolyglutamate synthase
VLIDGKPISEEEVVEWIDRRSPDIERLGATFFEATTALAMEYFATHEVDVVVLETGLGGRLDSTNVVEPLVATVTSIGMDHTDLLGDTIEQIAGEKAGIFKRGCPAVIGERDAEVAGVLRAAAAERGATPVHFVAQELTPQNVEVHADGTSFDIMRDGSVERMRSALVGEHQAWNAATALLTLDAAGGEWKPSMETAREAFAAVSLPGRFQRVGKRIFDVAHNPDGASVLARTLQSTGFVRPVIAILSVLGDKNWRGIMDVLATVVDQFILTTAPTAPAGRMWDVVSAWEYARSHGWSSQLVADFDEALSRGDVSGGTVLITGSFHTVGDAMARLQVDPLAG